MKLRLVALGLLALGPLAACLILYGTAPCRSAWNEIPVALGWSAQRPVWLLHPRWETYSSTRSSAFSLYPVRPERSSPTDLDQETMHGLLLITRDGLTPHDDHPLSLLLSSRLSSDGMETLLSDPYGASFNERIKTMPSDALIQADWLMSLRNRPAVPADLKVPSLAVFTRSNEPDGVADQPESDSGWRYLVLGSRILVEQSPRPFHSVGFTMASGRPDMGIWNNFVLVSISDPARAAYMTAMRGFIAAPPGELQTPFEERAQQAWRRLGLDTESAKFASRNDQGTSSQIVGWHCALHLDAIEELAEEASRTGQFDSAAEWLELASSVANRMAESVRSPWIYNYLQGKRATLRATATAVIRSQEYPPAIAGRMTALLDRLQPVAPRTIPAPAAGVLPAIYLDNLARVFLAIAAVTGLAGIAAWLIGRISPIRGESVGDESDWGSFFVAVLAIITTLVTLGLLEGGNYFGEGAASIVYGIAGIVFTVAILMTVWCFIARELVRTSDPTDRAFRQRLYGLSGCVAIAIACRVLLSFTAGQSRRGVSFEILERWAFDPTHERLPLAFRIAWSLAFPLLFGWYAWLRKNRWERDPTDSPLIHPLVIALTGVMIGSWMLLGPCGEWLHRDRSLALRYPTEWTPAVVAADAYGNLLEATYFWSRPRTAAIGKTYGPGVNLLTATFAARLSNLGWWFAIHCAAIWGFVVWQRDCVARARSRQGSRVPAPPIGPIWLAGVSGSFLWIASLALMLYGWSTLGMAYCIDRVFANS